jgi:putative addiction module CopG family antidote
MEVSLPADLTERLQQEVADGRYPSASAVIERAVRRFLEEQQSAKERLAALHRIGGSVDESGLYERVVLPDEE